MSSLSIQHSIKDEECLLTIEGDMTVYHIVEIKNQFLDFLYKCKTIIVDLGSVNEFDSSAAQVFVLIKREAIRLNKTLKCINHSEAVLTVLDLFGLMSMFSEKIHIPNENSDNLSYSYGTQKYPSFLRLK